MADNYLERQYADYLARKTAEERKKKLRWKKALKQYIEKTKSKPHNAENNPTTTDQ